MNNKMAATTNLSTIELKKNKVSKQAEQTQTHGYGDHWEGYQLGGGRGRMGEKAQGIRIIIGRYKIDRGRLRTV